MSKSLGTFLALIGLVLSCLSFYYVRHDRHIDNRPVLDVTDAHLISRESEKGYEFDDIQITVVNHGTRIASPTVVWSRDYIVIGDLDDLGEIPPNQSVQKTLKTKFDVTKFQGRPIRFVIEMKYRDRVEQSYSFNDETYFCASTKIGALPPVHPSGTLSSLEILSLETSVAPFPLYELKPPESLHKCGSYDVGWNE